MIEICYTSSHNRSPFKRHGFCSKFSHAMYQYGFVILKITMIIETIEMLFMNLNQYIMVMILLYLVKICPKLSEKLDIL
mgnify:CR=1 FL=1